MTHPLKKARGLRTSMAPPTFPSATATATRSTSLSRAAGKGGLVFSGLSPDGVLPETIEYPTTPGCPSLVHRRSVPSGTEVAAVRTASAVCASFIEADALEANPSDFQYLFQTVTGDRDVRSTSFGMEFDLPNALVSVVSPTGYHAMTDETLEPRGRGPRIEAVEMLFADLGVLRAQLDEAGIAFEDRGQDLVIHRR
jgi:hypothetical protein